MLTKQEQDFIEYWEKQRRTGSGNPFLDALKGTPKFLKFSLIIPVLYLVTFNLNQKWFQDIKKGSSETGYKNPYFDNPVIIFSILLGSILIAFFVSYFNRQFKNEQNEQYYQELKHKQKKQVT